MHSDLESTGFRRLSPTAARGVFAATVGVALLFVGIALSPYASGFADKPLKRPADFALYKAVIERVHAGDNYYDAMAIELPARGFPSKSVFNWRTPLPLWLIGILPTPGIGRALLALMALAMLFGFSHLLARDGRIGRGIGCGLLMVGAVLPCLLEGIFVLPELWSGVLLALSVLAYGIRRSGWGIFFGFAALVVRELAAPYCVLCCVLAVSERRWREVAAWSSAAVLYGLWYGFHVLHVLPRIGPNAIAHSEGWIQLGGAAFVISIAQMNAYLLQLPQWITGIYLMLALVGFAGCTAPWGRRAGLTAALYLGGFAVVGHPFNQYWGSMIAPLLCVGVAQAPAALADLWGPAVQRAELRGDQSQCRVATQLPQGDC